MPALSHLSPRLRMHLVTAGLFVGLCIVLWVAWTLRGLLVYLVLVAVAAVLYYALFLLVSARMRIREEQERAARGGADDELGRLD